MIGPFDPEVCVFRNARNRLDSFRLNNWPRDDINVRDLAEAGFFLPRIRTLPDEVECIFCRVRIGSWSPSLDAFHEHLRHFPRCDFLSGYFVGNIPLAGLANDPIRGPNRRIPSLDVCGHGGNSNQTSIISSVTSSTPLFTSSPSISSSNNSSSTRPSDSVSSSAIVEVTPGDPNQNEGAIHRPPMYCNFVTMQSRLKTYPYNWSPEFCPLSASSLAEAGFFYSGLLQRQLEPGKQPETLYDGVTCFHCGLKIFDWKPQDDPWKEHFRWSKECYFLWLTYCKPMKPPSSPQPCKSSPGQFDPSDDKSSQNTPPADLNTSSTTKGQQLFQANTNNQQNEPQQQQASEKSINPIDPLSDLSVIKHELSNISSGLESFNSQASSSSSTSDEYKELCKVCYMKEIEFSFLPCKHTCCCGQCTASLAKCPLCRSLISRTIPM